MAYCVRLVEMLRHHRVVPVLVFDGGALGAKAHTATKRRAARDAARETARGCEREVYALEARLAAVPRPPPAAVEALRAQLAAARKAFEEACQACVEVTPEHALQLIGRLRELGVEFVVAPYEADAQLAFLARSGGVEAVLTEDSDLVAFGCPIILYKLDRNSGEVSELRTERLQEVGAPFSLRGFTPLKFTQMCVLSGADYLESPRGLGLGTARKLLAQHDSIERVLHALRQSRTVELPADYAPRFAAAMLTFAHQRVYDARSQSLVPLTPLPDGLGLPQAELDAIIGADLPPDVAHGVATGQLHPRTHRPCGSGARARRVHGGAADAAQASGGADADADDADDADADVGSDAADAADGVGDTAEAHAAPDAALARALPAPRVTSQSLASALALGGGSGGGKELRQARAVCPPASAARRALVNPFHRAPEPTVSIFETARPAGGRTAHRAPALEGSSPDPVAARLTARFDATAASPLGAGSAPRAPPGAERPPPRAAEALCAHCAYTNARGAHVCVACDRLLGPARARFATPASAHAARAAVGGGGGARAGKRPLGLCAGGPALARTKSAIQGALPARTAGRPIASYFVPAKAAR